MDRIYVIYGDKPEEMVFSLLNEMKIEKDILDQGINPLIGIKPNLVVSQPAEWGATTSVEIVKAVINYLFEHNLKNIKIIESSWVGDNTKEAYRVCGYEQIREEYNIPLIDLKEDTYEKVQVGDIEINICKEALAVDYLINLPVLKAHCQTKMTCALKNLKGCIPDFEKKRFHKMGLEFPIACLNKVLRTNLVIVDGIIGDLTYEGGGNPVKMERIIAGKDPVLVDAYAANLLGYSIEDIEHIRLAKKLGVGNAVIDNKVIELNKRRQISCINDVLDGIEVDHLQKWIISDQACSACYGSLFHGLKRLDEKDKLGRLKQKVYIGQGFRNRDGIGIGIGNCTKNFKYSLGGCPPQANKIVEFLLSFIEEPH